MDVGNSNSRIVDAPIEGANGDNEAARQAPSEESAEDILAAIRRRIMDDQGLAHDARQKNASSMDASFFSRILHYLKSKLLK